MYSGVEEKVMRPFWNTDMKFEQENIASLMKMAVQYGRSIGFDGDFYIEPKPKEPMKHQYDYDAATAIAFFKRVWT